MLCDIHATMPLLIVLQNPLNLATIQAPSNHNDRKEKNGIRYRLLVVFHACSVSLLHLSTSLLHLFSISNPYLAGEEPTLSLGKCAWLSHCPNAHQRCVPMLTCLIGAAARAIHAVNLTTSPLSHTVSAPAQPCGQVQHASLAPACYGPIRALYHEGSI